MSAPPKLTDSSALARYRSRATAHGMFLHTQVADEIKERLTEVNKTFTSVAIVTGFPDFWREALPDAVIVADEEVLALKEAAHDLVVHAMALHWANDPVGQLVQCRRALQPDGLFIGVCFGGETLQELRASLATAESRITGGLSPRIAPMGEIRDLGALLQRAGFALPVADGTTLKASYQNMFHLMHDLRAMGETNALASRLRKLTRRNVMTEAAGIYAETYGDEGRITATFDIITLTGWAPADGQPKPLRPGSATQRLADALGTDEVPLSRTKD